MFYKHNDYNILYPLISASTKVRVSQAFTFIIVLNWIRIWNVVKSHNIKLKNHMNLYPLFSYSSLLVYLKNLYQHTFIISYLY